MKHLILFGLIILICLQSCENSDDVTNNDYSNKNEILLPTDSPRGLAFDGEYLWYSDDSLKTLNKISSDGDILKTIELDGCNITDFDFYQNYIWCINDTTVLYDTTIFSSPFSCIYKYSNTGKRLDSILIQGSINPQEPEFTGIAACDSVIYFSTNQGYSSSICCINIESEEITEFSYQYMNGLTLHNDTIFAIDKSYTLNNRIVNLDSEYQIIVDNIVTLNYEATDLVFIDDEIWICDRENKILRKIE